MSTKAKEVELPRPGVPVRRSDAQAFGLSEWQVTRSSQFLKVAQGLYTARPENAERELEMRARAAVRAVGDGVQVCGVTALKLLGADIPSALDTEVISLLLPPTATAWPRCQGLVAHRVQPVGESRQFRGLTLADPWECWLQVARRAQLDDAVVLGDGLIRRQRPIADLGDLHDLLQRSKRKAGLSKGRAALELLRPGTDSPTETLTRLLLISAGLPCPVVNYPVRTRDGVRYLDMAYVEQQVAVEYDGQVHDRPGAREEDARRRRVLEDLGWRIITVTYRDLRHSPLHLIRSVQTALAAKNEQFRC
jgi:hypothetical protein